MGPVQTIIVSGRCHTFEETELLSCVHLELMVRWIEIDVKIDLP